MNKTWQLLMKSIPTTKYTQLVAPYSLSEVMRCWLLKTQS